MRYQVVKDKKTGEALVERIEPFFELPIVLYTFGSRREAISKVLALTQATPWPWKAYKV